MNPNSWNTNTTLPKGDYRTESSSYKVQIKSSTTETAVSASEIVRIINNAAESVHLDYDVNQSNLHQLIRKINSK